MNELSCIGAKLWEKNYAIGGNSGAGSYDKSATFKARVLNQYVSEQQIGTVLEFGCGDGNQLSLAKYPQYAGYDVSPTAVELCRKKFAGDSTKSFDLVSAYTGAKADMAMSLDVIYHIIEQDIWEAYLRRLFNAANKAVVVYSTNKAYNAPDRQPHMYHREFLPWVASNIQGWDVVRYVPNECGYDAHFYIYEKIEIANG